jgi:hypothetical protein
LLRKASIAHAALHNPCFEIADHRLVLAGAEDFATLRPDRRQRREIHKTTAHSAVVIANQ